MRASRLALVASLALLPTPVLRAHPGSGIALDARGNVLFIDTGAGVWRLSADGKLSEHGGPAFHWMALDPAGAFAAGRLPVTGNSEMRTTGRDPQVIVSSDYPIAVAESALFYTQPGAGGALELIRVAPGGERSVRARLPKTTAAGELRWINGIAAGREGSILFTDDRAIYRVARDGTVALVREVDVPQCAVPPLDDFAGSEDFKLPDLRGVAEAADGTLWVAASACSAVVRVPPRGEPEVALRAESPWSPTAVAVGAGGVYVLEYLHTKGDDRRVWVPRVRRLAANGQAETLVTIRRDQ